MIEIETRGRFDALIIWGHGLEFADDIMGMVRDTECFEIVRVIKHCPKNMKAFVRKVYSYDYAPIAHLKSKVRYLESVQPNLLCLVIKNSSPDIEIFGEGSFRHEESLTLKKLKSEIRERFNPYVGGEMTHNHVIHTTDNEAQTNHILQAIGDSGVKQYYENNLFSIPFFLGTQTRFEVIEVKFSQLLCGQASGDQTDFRLNYKPIGESIQYECLGGDVQRYKDYVSSFLGAALKCDYHVDGFLALAENFEYLAKGYEKYYVVVKRYLSDKYLVVDGLHRASIHLFQGNEKIKVCLIP